jgi:hypothetical protein
MDLRPRDIYIVLEYLRRGGKVKMDGRTYVWLNNQVVNETATHVYTIDGLAIEGRKYQAGEDIMDPHAGEPHYMGANDMPINMLLEHINNIDFAEFARIAQELRVQFDKEGKLHI